MVFAAKQMAQYNLYLQTCETVFKAFAWLRPLVLTYTNMGDETANATAFWRRIEIILCDSLHGNFARYQSKEPIQ